MTAPPAFRRDRPSNQAGPGCPGERSPGSAASASWLPQRRYPLEDYRTFIEALDLLPHGLAFFDLSGMLLCANRALAQAVDEISDGDLLFDEVLRLGRAVADHQRRPDATSPPRPTDASAGRRSCELLAAEGTYRIAAQRVDVDLFGLGASVLVTVEAPRQPAPSPEALRLRFGLTPSEAHVARLLGEGRSNRSIAAELRISPHTARHHTERVLRKLGLRSRAEVGRRMNSASETSPEA